MRDGAIMVRGKVKTALSLKASDVPFCTLLGSAGRAVSEVEKKLGAHPIRAPFLGILWLVNSEPGHAQGEYAAALHYDLATFGRHVEVLVGQGLMEKTQAENDHRVMELRVSDQGRESLRTHLASMREIDRQVEHDLGRDDYRELARLLKAYLGTGQRA